MKFKALKYGEFFQGQISVYTNKRPLFVKFLDCVEQKNQEWKVQIEPINGLNTGMVLAINQNVLCEIINKKDSYQKVRLLNPNIDIRKVWNEIDEKSGN